MPSTITSQLLVGGALIAAAAVAMAAAPVTVSVTGGWTRPVAKGQMAGGYFIVTNTGKRADKLLSITSPVSAKVGMHQSLMQGDMAIMRPVVGGLALAPGQTVKFEPGGYHLMIENVKAEQKLGGALPLVLTFQHAGKVKAELKVTGAAPK